MEQSASWEGDSFSDRQEHAPKTHYRVTNAPQLLLILIHMNPFGSHFLKILFNIIPPYKPAYSKWSLYNMPYQRLLCAPLLFPILATCPVHLSLLDFDHPSDIWWMQITKLLIILPSPPPLTSSLLGPNFFLSTLYPTVFPIWCPCNVADHVSCPHKRTENIFLFILGFQILNSKLEYSRF